MTRPILIVGRNGPGDGKLAAAFHEAGVELRVCSCIEETRRMLSRGEYAAVLCQDPPPDGGFGSLIEQVRRVSTSIPVVIVSPKDGVGPQLMELISTIARFA